MLFIMNRHDFSSSYHEIQQTAISVRSNSVRTWKPVTEKQLAVKHNSEDTLLTHLNRIEKVKTGVLYHNS